MQGEVTERTKKNRNLEDRAKKLLEEATGTSAPELDNMVWEAVSKHRARLRQETAPSDAEPDGEEARLSDNPGPGHRKVAGVFRRYQPPI
jgi:hypothetical protein